MRLLVVNANTSDIRDREGGGPGAPASASAGTEVVAVTGTFGGRVIGTRTEQAIGEHSAPWPLLARHAAGLRRGGAGGVLRHRPCAPHARC
jgi:hypothetical protein